MAAGITKVGTTIFIYDDSDTSGGRAAGPYTFAQISAAFPADFIDNGTNRKSYRSTLNLQVGDSGVGTATTTLQDTDVTVIFDSTRTLVYRSTQTTSWFTTLGTKVGSGDEATGVQGCDITFGAATVLRGTVQLYGCTLRQKTGAVTWTPPAALTGEAVNCLFQSSAAAASPFVMGTSGVNSSIDNLYNCDFSHTLASSFAITNFFVGTASRLTLGAPTPANLIASGSASIGVRDLVLFGSPSQSDIRWTAASSANWSLVRPKFTGNAPKFSCAAAASGTLFNVANATVEYWTGLWKTVDGSGVAVAGVPVRVTDSFGNVAVDTTTDAHGEISYGSGITAECVAVMDHYVDGSANYIQRHRSPFLVEINMPTQTGYNSFYRSHYYYMDWPGSESVTTTSGSFMDVGDIVQMAPAPGNPTIWTEATQA